MNKDKLLRELTKLKNTSEEYSNDATFNDGYRTSMMDAIDLVEQLNVDSLIAFAKWTTTMQEMFIEDSEAYVDQFIKESNS